MEKNIFEHLEILKPINTKITLRFVQEGIAAGGFTSPALDHIEDDIDLGKLFVKNKYATFLARVKGNSMIDAGFEENDIMIVDRSVPAVDGSIAVCFLDGQFNVKRLKIDSKNEVVWLVPENKEMSPIKIDKQQDFQIWGTVTWHCKPV